LELFLYFYYPVNLKIHQVKRVEDILSLDKIIFPLIKIPETEQEAPAQLTTGEAG